MGNRKTNVAKADEEEAVESTKNGNDGEKHMQDTKNHCEIFRMHMPFAARPCSAFLFSFFSFILFSLLYSLFFFLSLPFFFHLFALFLSSRKPSMPERGPPASTAQHGGVCAPCQRSAPVTKPIESIAKREMQSVALLLLIVRVCFQLLFAA